jgi:hypothetical protein
MPRPRHTRPATPTSGRSLAVFGSVFGACGAGDAAGAVAGGFDSACSALDAAGGAVGPGTMRVILGMFAIERTGTGF